MQIIVGGGGKVGSSLAHELSHEGHNVLLIDVNQSAINKVIELNDVNSMIGSITSIDLQKKAGVAACDVFVAVTNSDEVNITAAIIAKNLGAKHTIARVRDTEYASHIGFMRNSLGISYLVNPEYETARHLGAMLQFPAAYALERFISGNVVMMEGEIAQGSFLNGVNLIEFRKKFPSLIITAVARGEDISIPSGTFVLKSEDRILVTGLMKDLQNLYAQFPESKNHFKNILIVGGGRITYYLLRYLQKSKIRIDLVEINESRANELAGEFPEIRVVIGDGTEHLVLDELHHDELNLLLALTGMDEQNIMISLYALSKKIPRIMTKVNRTDLLPLLAGFDLQTTVTPHLIACEGIMRYIRARGNTRNSQIEALYRLMNNRVLAIEFNVPKDSKLIDTPIKDLEFRNESLIAFIFREGKVIFPHGSSELKPHDRVAIMTKDLDITSLDDAIAFRQK